MMEQERLEELLDEKGEVTVTLLDGSVYELHKHDVEFEDGNVVIDHDEEYHEFDPYDITGVSVHQSGEV